jgi:hypothetical protein
MREKLFTLTKKDFEVQTFRGSGPGGQHRNKTDSAVRIIHKESGASAESQTSRSQRSNKKVAFERLSKTPKFKLWLSKRIHNLPTSPEEIEILDKDIITEFQVEGKWKKQ